MILGLQILIFLFWMLGVTISAWLMGEGVAFQRTRMVVAGALLFASTILTPPIMGVLHREITDTVRDGRDSELGPGIPIPEDDAR